MTDIRSTRTNPTFNLDSPIFYTPSSTGAYYRRPGLRLQHRHLYGACHDQRFRVGYSDERHGRRRRVGDWQSRNQRRPRLVPRWPTAGAWYEFDRTAAPAATVPCRIRSCACATRRGSASPPTTTASASSRGRASWPPRAAPAPGAPSLLRDRGPGPAGRRDSRPSGAGLVDLAVAVEGQQRDQGIRHRSARWWSATPSLLRFCDGDRHHNRQQRHLVVDDSSLAATMTLQRRGWPNSSPSTCSSDLIVAAVTLGAEHREPDRRHFDRPLRWWRRQRHAQRRRWQRHARRRCRR